MYATEFNSDAAHVAWRTKGGKGRAKSGFSISTAPRPPNSGRAAASPRVTIFRRPILFSHFPNRRERPSRREGIVRIDPPALSAEPSRPLARVGLVDMARGAALLAMFVFHFTWDLSAFGWIDENAPFNPGFKLFGHAIAASF